MANYNMLRALSQEGGVIFLAVDSTEIVREMERIHHTSAVTSAALGRLLTAASLMGALLQDEQDSVTLRLDGGGPAGLVVAVALGTGDVKGYVQNPVVELPPRADGHLNVGAAVGADGTLSVSRDAGGREPYIGQVPLVSGEVAEDITRYYAASEQVPTVCALGVLVNPDLSIACAGGYLVQLLPGATEDEIARLERNVAAMPSVTQLLQQGQPPADWMQRVMDGFAPQLLDERTVGYHCGCSEKRVEGILRSLGVAELTRMCAEEPTAEVVCHFCGKKYQVPLPELLQKMQAKNS